MYSDKDILAQIELGNLEITPFDKNRLGSNSYDLTLSKHIAYYIENENSFLPFLNPVRKLFRRIFKTIPKASNIILDSCKENPFERTIIGEKGFVLLPNRFYLMSVNESIYTRNCAVMIEGKSSGARLSISVHDTAGVGDIGFSGYFTLEVTVTHKVRVYENMPVAQFLFYEPKTFTENTYDKKPSAKYSNQNYLPQPSKMWKNFQ